MLTKPLPKGKAFDLTIARELNLDLILYGLLWSSKRSAKEHGFFNL